MEQTPTPSPVQPQKSNLLIPGAIVIAGLLIAGGLFAAQIINGNRSAGSVATKRPENPHLETKMKPVGADDHIRGSADAPIKVVEYSDTDCPYCQLFHPTVKSLVDKYPTKVAWVYRYFNTQIPAHLHTESEARALECVAHISGNDTYWKVLDALVTKKDFTKSPAVLIATSSLPNIVASLGVNKAQFTDCFNKGTYADIVAADTQNAQASGGNGTPFSIVTTKNPVSKDIENLLKSINDQYVSQAPNAPDIAFVSKDKKMIVLAGAMPQQFMDQLFDMLTKIN